MPDASGPSPRHSQQLEDDDVLSPTWACGGSISIMSNNDTSLVLECAFLGALFAVVQAALFSLFMALFQFELFSIIASLFYECWNDRDLSKGLQAL